MMNLTELTETLQNLVNSPYRNIFTFENEEQEAEYNRELDQQIEAEAREAIEKFQNQQ